MNALLNADGTNSSIPTSKTPLSQKKIIPNSRKKERKKDRRTARTSKKHTQSFCRTLSNGNKTLQSGKLPLLRWETGENRSDY